MRKFILWTVIASFFFSCDPDQIETITDVDSTTDHSSAQSEFDDVITVVEQALQERRLFQKTNDIDSLCAEITGNQNDSLIIDFGEGGCFHKGRLRKGRLLIHYTGPYLRAGTVVSTTLENYEVNGVRIEGKEIVTNQGMNDEGQWRFKVEVINGQLTYPTGEIATWESTRFRMLIDEGTSLLFDGTYAIYGTATGINRSGRAYTVSIDETTPLIIHIPCALTTRLPQEGILTIIPDGLTPRVIDYGDGECDTSISVSVDSKSIQLDL